MEYDILKQKLLDCFAPHRLACNTAEWGFARERAGAQITAVGCAVSLTPEVVDCAARRGVELLLTHHDAWDFVPGLRAACNALLERHGITHAFFHAPLDDAAFGTSATLADMLGLRDCAQIIPYQKHYLCGVMGALPSPLPFGEFAALLEQALGERPRAWCNSGRPVCRVCVTAGGGNMTGDMEVAVQAGCDTYVTGEYSLYSQQYARLAGVHLLVGSHTATERPGIRSLARLLTRDTGLRLELLDEADD